MSNDSLRKLGCIFLLVAFFGSGAMQARVNAGDIKFGEVATIMSKYPTGTIVTFTCSEVETPEQRDEVTRVLNEAIGYSDQRTP